MDLVTYFRRQPWRPRSPWLGVRAGARRRGFRQDELALATGVMAEGADEVLAVSSAATMDDAVLVDAVSEPAAPCPIPTRVDISGLQAIAALAPDRFSPIPEGGASPAIDWHAYGARNDEELYLARHSA